MRKIYTECPVEYTASLIANKWKILILRDLLTGTKRYNELTKSIVGISSKVLTENLRQLESDGLYFRHEISLCCCRFGHQSCRRRKYLRILPFG